MEPVLPESAGAWDHRNLFLLGSGVFPTVATSNPSLTIGALSLMAAGVIQKDLTALAGTSG